MKIAIITALPEESRGILKIAGQIHDLQMRWRTSVSCCIAGHEITLVEAGMGMLNAGWAASILAMQEPELLISAGFGGGVISGLAVGDVVIAEKVLHWTGNDFEQVAPMFYSQHLTGSQAFLRGEFITSDKILEKKQLAALLPQNICRPVAEMESSAVARVAAEHGIPFLGVRVISDPWSEDLGFSINELCNENMRISPKLVAATILKRPRLIFQFIRLYRNSRIAAKNLGLAIERLLAQT
jgi:adenosylhomocysteine nucleosidase